MTPCPCKDCAPPVRHIGCHSICEGYIEWKSMYDEAHNKNKAYNEIDNALKSLKMRT